MESKITKILNEKRKWEKDLKEEELFKVLRKDFKFILEKYKNERDRNIKIGSAEPLLFF